MSILADISILLVRHRLTITAVLFLAIFAGSVTMFMPELFSAEESRPRDIAIGGDAETTTPVPLWFVMVLSVFVAFIV